MVVREKFEQELSELKDKILEMEKLASKAMENAYEALIEQNVDLALKVFEDDKKLDKLEEEIDDLAILMIAKQQPVASDLRHIISAIKISTELERVGDYAKNIAKSAIRLAKEDQKFNHLDVEQMYVTCREMLALFKQAYIEDSINTAKDLAEMDDQVDKRYGQVIASILATSSPDNGNSNQRSQLLFIVRHYERIGDHITNMAEAVIYMIKGRHYHLNE